MIVGRCAESPDIFHPTETSRLVDRTGNTETASGVKVTQPELLRTMEVMKTFNDQSLNCDRCNFHGTDYDSVQIHKGTIHPEFCDEMDTAGLGKLVFYQKSARLFHCHRCFFTSKIFSNVYYHILSRHGMSEKWRTEEKPILETKSEASSVNISGKNSEKSTSEDEKSVADQEQKDKLSEDEKPDENDTLSSWPEKTPKEESQESSDSESKSSIVEQSIAQSPEAKEKESSSEPDLESESSSSSSKLSKINSVPARDANEFSDNEATSSHSKDIPQFSDEEEPDEETPALPDSLPNFSEDEEMITQPKGLEESSDDEEPDQSRGIEDISEDEEMPVDDKGIENVSEDEAPMQTKEVAESSEEDDVPAKETIDFSDKEDVPPLTKDALEFSEDEPTSISKNMTELSEEEDESAVAAKNLMGFTEEEEEVANVSKNIMEFSEEEEDTPSLSKDIMEFSEEEEDTPAMSKSIMEFSEEEDGSPPSKNMPKYSEGNLTPTQLKDTLDDTEDGNTSAMKKPSALSEDEETPIKSNFAKSKDAPSSSMLEETPTHTAGGFPLSEDEAASSWSKDLSETPETGDISANASDMPDTSDDKDGFIRDEEIMKHVRRVKGKFYCMLCECRPLKKGPVLHHLITRHNMPSPFICKTCGKTFVMETHLKNHLSSHTKGLYKCSRCNFQTDHPRGFKKHQTHCQRVHKDETEQTVLDFEQNKEEN
ncbi:chromosome alignment maintaining phosphoprotein 1 S homeolog isoform X2 [Xenopus laevis]|uniref:Chromosome alignment maintaining phosphoprotein 1 S homeolog isoform X2 n=1 Tax=Xenopus laevis TaxID=8355 RepID=A0A8J0UKB2_XENLA|nr:chromosome alignment maintaining phosphoprotein 1 S homeolog isoform X2 [Xenopus laevis]